MTSPSHLWSFSNTAFQGCLSRSDGSFAACSPILPNRNPVWIGIGFSHHSVPSLSKNAMRAAGGTKSLLPFFVTRATKSSIADFVAVSFQEASGLLPFAETLAVRLRAGVARDAAAFGNTLRLALFAPVDFFLELGVAMMCISAGGLRFGELPLAVQDFGARTI